MLRTLYVPAALAMAGFYYYFIGAGPGPSELFDDLEWWRPRGWLLRWDAMLSLAELADREGAERLIPVYLLWIPPLALTVGGLLLFKSALLRASFFWLGCMLLIVTWYGIGAERVWRFFEWRFVAVAASFTAVVTLILFGPSLLRQLARVPRAIAGMLLLLLFAGVFVLQTEVTGTDPDMRFNISPWPVVTVFGLLLTGYCLAALHITAGAGLWVTTRMAGPAGKVTGAVVAAALAASSCFFIFSDPAARLVVLFAATGVVYMLVALAMASEERTPVSASSLSRVAAGVLVLAMVGVSNQAARSNQRIARDTTAHVILKALEQYKDDHKEYPERLKHLVPDYLAQVPKSPIGWLPHEDKEFDYSNFGDSYALEFSSVQWVQCAYSPPYEFADYDEDAEDYEQETIAEGWEEEDEAWQENDIDVAARPESDDESEATERLRASGLAGSWNCPKEPPKIW